MRLSLLCAAVLAAFVSSAHAQGEAPTPESEQLFLQGMQQRSAGNYEDAIKAFQSILSNQPSLNRARLELAVAYFQSYDFGRARAEAQKVLDDPAAPEAVKANVRQFLASLAAESKPSLFTPYISAGYGRDSNVNVGPSGDSINIGGNALTLVPGATKQADNYYQVNAGVSHRYLAMDSVNFFGHPAAFLWQSNANYFTNQYQSLGQFDLDVVSVSTGPAIVSRDRYRANLSFQFDDISLGHSHLAQYTSLNPSFTWIVGKTEITLDGQAQRRSFAQVALVGRDSDYESGGVSVSHTMLDDKLGLIAGARRFNEDAEISRFGNTGKEYFLGASYKPWTGGTIFFRSSLKYTGYKDVEPLFNIARNETEHRNVVGVSHKFGDGFMKDWTVAASANLQQVRSTVSIYTYDRNITGATLSRSF